jgi:hypothetical protein
MDLESILRHPIEGSPLRFPAEPFTPFSPTEVDYIIPWAHQPIKMPRVAPQTVSTPLTNSMDRNGGEQTKEVKSKPRYYFAALN